MQAQEKILVSRTQAAQVLSVPRKTVDRLVRRAVLKARIVDGRVLVSVESMQKFARGEEF